MHPPVELDRSHLPPLLSLSRRARLSGCWMQGAALVVSLAALLPLAFIVWIAIQTRWETDSALIFRPRVAELLVNTVLLVTLSVPLCARLSVAHPWLTGRRHL